MLQNIATPAKDPILSLSIEYRADDRDNKVDLGIGVYRNDQGHTPIMKAVSDSAKAIAAEQTTKAYVGLAGCEVFNQSMVDLLLRDTSAYERVSAIQTPGASGALRMIADLIKSTEPSATVWISNPSYINHQPVMEAAGLKVKHYSYFNPTTKQVDSEAMMADLANAGPKDIILLHGCCHNPTGSDIRLSDWISITELALKNGFIPFVDIAYQGFGDGLESDAAGLRFMADRVPQMFIATSCSKNFGLYRERTGAAMVIAANIEIAMNAKAKLLQMARATYTMPPDHGAAIVGRILNDEALTLSWRTELDEMQKRLLGLRSNLCAALRDKTQSTRFDFIEQHKGMFSVIGFNGDQMAQLKSDHGIYAVGDGRINIAGMQEQHIDYIAKSVASVANK
ncbi:amino acid aminotransferase [Aliivibrio salmonicida]|uniref:amino acid aminotransferase n=1 Tax=Aliivibrio salmonicida TaxID=40269 RepID=UPI003D0A1821